MTESLRQYQDLWQKIASASAGEGTPVVCHKSFVRTLIQAVRKEKTAANMLRKQLELSHYGRLHQKIEPIVGTKDKVRVTFTLTFNGDHL